MTNINISKNSSFRIDLALSSYMSQDPKVNPLFKFDSGFSQKSFIIQQLIDVCPICLNKYSKNPIIFNKYLHIFCKKCIYIWSKRNNYCPICKSNFSYFIKS